MRARWQSVRLLRSFGVVVVIVLSVLVLSPAGSALAATPQAISGAASSPGGGAPSQATLSRQAGTGSAPLQGNPYGCYGRSDYPHISSHYPDRVAAQGWTICSVQLPYEHVDSTLYRQDCWWIFCWWTQVGYASNTNNFISYGAVRAVPSHVCSGSSSHLYEIDSYHEVHDAAGNVYTAYTANDNTVACG